MGCSIFQPGSCRASDCTVMQQNILIEELRHLLFCNQESNVCSAAQAAFCSAWLAVLVCDIPSAALSSESQWNVMQYRSLDLISEGGAVTYMAICLHTYPNNQIDNPLTAIHRKNTANKEIIRSSGKHWTCVLVWIASLFNAFVLLWKKKKKAVLFSKLHKFW